MFQQQAPQGMTMMPDPNQQDLSGNYYPQESDLTVPINLDCLRDTPPGSKPFYPYSTLVDILSFYLAMQITILQKAQVRTSLYDDHAQFIASPILSMHPDSDENDQLGQQERLGLVPYPSYP
jgi:hypothetical protein